MTFKEAFRAARNAGKKTFTWNGKSYTTELAEEKAAVRNAPSRPRARPERPSSPRPRANPRASNARTEDPKGNTGNVNSPQAKRTRMEQRIRSNESSVNIPRTLGAGLARFIDDSRRTRTRAATSRPASADRYQRGAAGPRR